ncbi:MAG: tetratricopeptide repeat protein [Fidelibacterota bacterium]
MESQQIRSENVIPRDVRNLFPAVKEVPTEEELIGRIETDEYLEKTEEVYGLNLVSPEGALDDLAHIPELKSPDQRGIAWACLAGVHAFNGNYRKAITAFNKALDEELSDDSKAYVFLSLSNLLRKLGYIRESLAVLDAASQMATHDNLKWRITTLKGLSQKYSSPESALSVLEKCRRHYQETENYVRLGAVVRHMGSINIDQKEFGKAMEYIEEAMDLATRHNLTKHEFAATNDKGWLLINMGRIEEARNLFQDLLMEDLPAYDMSLALQNLGYLEFENRDYRESIKYHSQSLQLTTRYEIRDMAFEDYYKLGLCHQNLGELALADHFYSLGYEELLQEVRMGLPILGYREKLLTSYVTFLERNQPLPRPDIQKEVFRFAKDKTMKEIRNIFRKSLLNLHLERSKNAPQMCRHLDIDTRTYFLYQKKLGLKRGEARKSVVVDSTYFEQYVESLVPLTWREANRKFEEDLFSFLLTTYQHNKTKIAKVLNVSYQQVVQKTT